jgi:heme A synthase
MKSHIPTSFELKALVLVTLATAFLQVSLGGFVRVSESGLGCPDWPLCHGQLIPPFEYHTMIEYSHRLTGTVLGLLVLLIVSIVLFKYRNQKHILIPTISSFALVIFAGILGGVTVITELVWWVRLVHLGIAQALIASLTILASFLFLSGKIEIPNKLYSQRKSRVTYVLIVVYLLILSGSYVVGAGATAVCTAWPLCQGFSVPWEEIYVIHMVHRYVALIAFLGMLYIGVKWLRKPLIPRRIKIAIHSLFGLIVFQVVIGAIIVWSDFHPHLKASHLTFATLVWISAVYFAFVMSRVSTSD